MTELFGGEDFLGYLMITWGHAVRNIKKNHSSISNAEESLFDIEFGSKRDDVPLFRVILPPIKDNSELSGRDISR